MFYSGTVLLCSLCVHADTGLRGIRRVCHAIVSHDTIKFVVEHKGRSTRIEVMWWSTSWGRNCVTVTDSAMWTENLVGFLCEGDRSSVITHTAWQRYRWVSAPQRSINCIIPQNFTTPQSKYDVNKMARKFIITPADTVATVCVPTAGFQALSV